MIPGKEERKFFVIHVIVKDRTGLVNIVTREMTHVTDYCEHYQAYKLPENFRLREPDWRCFTLCDLDDTSFSFNNLCCRVTIHNLQIIQRFRGIQTGIDFNIGHWLYTKLFTVQLLVEFSVVKSIDIYRSNRFVIYSCSFRSRARALPQGLEWALEGFGWRATMSRVSAAMVRPIGCSGEHLNGSGGLTNRPPRAPDCFRRMRKVVQPPEPLGCNNEWIGYYSLRADSTSI